MQAFTQFASDLDEASKSN
ncbi:hypothetical protein ACMAV8_06230 [Helicobacter pylori]